MALAFKLVGVWLRVLTSKMVWPLMTTRGNLYSGWFNTALWAESRRTEEFGFFLGYHEIGNRWRQSTFTDGECRGIKPCTSYSRTNDYVKLWLRHCVQLYAQQYHAWAKRDEQHEHRRAHERAQHAVLSTLRAAHWCVLFTSHLGSSPPCTRHPIHACAPVCCVLVVFSSTVSVFYFFPPLSFQPFQMFSSVFIEKFRSNPLCDFRLGTVATSDHETPLTKSVWSFFGRTIMGKAIWESPIETWMGENSKMGMSLRSSWKRIVLICVCGWHQIGWRCGKYSIKKLIWENQHLSFIMYIWAVLKDNVKLSTDIVHNYRTMFESRISAWATEKLPCTENLSISSWSYDMEGHAKKCVERYCELANKTTQQLYKVSTPCIDDHHFKEEETKSVGELSNTCYQIVLKCLYLARIGRPDILCSVNKLARSITKWTKVCDKRLHRFIS